MVSQISSLRGAYKEQSQTFFKLGNALRHYFLDLDSVWAQSRNPECLGATFLTLGDITKLFGLEDLDVHTIHMQRRNISPYHYQSKFPPKKIEKMYESIPKA